MKLVIFGLTLSSSWGNGHATLLRGLIRALVARGHAVTFFERDVPYYAQHRDLSVLPGADLILYTDWKSVHSRARRELTGADVVMITSYCPDAVAAADLSFEQPSRMLRVFYDLDTPVTLARLQAGESVRYLPREGLSEFDLALSYTGGPALDALRNLLGARQVAPLYGHVDPSAHCPAQPDPRFRGDLSYLGTYAPDRQHPLEMLFLTPACARPDQRFVLGGSGYPPDFPWRPNIWFVRHVAPPEHAAFFCSSRLTLNVTRRDMALMGYCPSGRLFEAAACGVPLISDEWHGLEAFFTPGREILLARKPADVMAALSLTSAELDRLARAARERVLEEHSSERRAIDLLRILEEARHGRLRRHDATAQRAPVRSSISRLHAHPGT